VFSIWKKINNKEGKIKTEGANDNMTFDEIRKKFSEAQELKLEQIDELCFEWLRLVAEDCGRDGEIGILLLDILQKHLVVPDIYV